MPQTPEPYYTQCKNAAESEGSSLCSSDHCNQSNVKGFTHDMCTCSGQYAHMKVNGKCPFGYGSAIPVLGTTCDCCCGCFAYGTPISITAEETRPIQEIAVGEKILVAATPDLAQWVEKDVLFSNGAGGQGSSNLMLNVFYEGENGDPDYLVCSRDQPFLMPDRKIKVASKLVPGVDTLVRQDGSTAKVYAIRAGHLATGLHHVATSVQPAKTLDGHLMLAKGIVVADYAVQIAQGVGTADSHFDVADNHDDLPDFGTAAYIDTHTHLQGDEHGVHLPEHEEDNAEHEAKLNSEAGFDRVGKHKAVPVPAHAQYFLSKAQALDLAAEPNLPVAGVDTYLWTYLSTLYGAFFPDVKFYFDQNALEPNAYSYHYAGVPFVIVNDGLLRKPEMRFELLAFIIAHELGHLYGGDPQDDHGLSCTGQADYAAIQVVMNKVFFGHRAQPVMQEALKQMKALLGKYVSKDNAAGKKGDTCHDIPLACRYEAIENAMTLLPLPHCAGGPPDPALEVASATVDMSGDAPVVTVCFNMEVDADSAVAPGNYELDPNADVSSVAMSKGDGKSVEITFEKLDPGTTYKLWAYSVTSKDGNPLIGDKNEAGFETPAASKG